MTDQSALTELFAGHGYVDFRWIDPASIIVAQWVRMKCTFGCGEYGRNATCPPATPSVAECRDFFGNYSLASIFRFVKAVDRPEDRHTWSRGVNTNLVKLERAVFLAGYPKAFVLAMDSCTLCADCTGARVSCKSPRLARPSPESMAVDVFATVRQVGYPIEVLTDYTQAMNRYAILLIQ